MRPLYNQLYSSKICKKKKSIKLEIISAWFVPMHIESFPFQRSRGNYEVAMCNDKENKTAKLDTEEGKKESHILMEGKYQRILYFEEKQKYFFQLLSFHRQS